MATSAGPVRSTRIRPLRGPGPNRPRSLDRRGRATLREPDGAHRRDHGEQAPGRRRLRGSRSAGARRRLGPGSVRRLTALPPTIGLGPEIRSPRPDLPAWGARRVRVRSGCRAGTSRACGVIVASRQGGCSRLPGPPCGRAPRRCQRARWQLHCVRRIVWARGCRCAWLVRAVAYKASARRPIHRADVLRFIVCPATLLLLWGLVSADVPPRPGGRRSGDSPGPSRARRVRPSSAVESQLQMERRDREEWPDAGSAAAVAAGRDASQVPRRGTCKCVRAGSVGRRRRRGTDGGLAEERRRRRSVAGRDGRRPSAAWRRADGRGWSWLARELREVVRPHGPSAVHHPRRVALPNDDARQDQLALPLAPNDRPTDRVRATNHVAAPARSGRLTVSVEQAARLLGISRGLAYTLVGRGEIPSLRLGRRIVVPRRALDRMLDLRDDSG
jgi:excisionase family DNA binding protein